LVCCPDRRLCLMVHVFLEPVIGRNQFICRHHVINQPPLQRILCIVHIACHHHFQRFSASVQLRQSLCAAVSWNDPQRNLCEPHLCKLTSHTDMAGHG